MRRRVPCRAARLYGALLAASFLILDDLAWAQTPRPTLTLAAARAQASQQHPALRVAVLAREASQASVTQAGAWRNPELSTLLEDTRRDTRTTTVQLNQPIELGGKRQARVQVAEHAWQQAQTDVAAKLAQVDAQVIAAFRGVLVAQERLQLSRDLQSLAGRASQAVARRVAAGKVSPVEAVKARIAEAQTSAMAAQALSQWRTARQRLGAAMGEVTWSEDQPVDAMGEPLPSLDIWSDLNGRIEASPATLRARQEVWRRQALSAGEKALQTPDVTLSLGVKRDRQLGRDQALIGFSVALPVFDRNQGGLLEASRREDQARAEVDALIASQRVQVGQAIEQLASALAQLQAWNEEVLPGATQALDASIRGYELGKFNVIDVLDAQRTFFEAKSQALQAKAQVFEADATLRELLGEPANAGANPSNNQVLKSGAQP